LVTEEFVVAFADEIGAGWIFGVEDEGAQDDGGDAWGVVLALPASVGVLLGLEVEETGVDEFLRAVGCCGGRRGLVRDAASGEDHKHCDRCERQRLLELHGSSASLTLVSLL